jgi:hypothetical protein
LGTEKGPVAAGLAVGFWVPFLLMSRIIRKYFRDIDFSTKAISDTQNWTSDRQQQVLKKLRSAKTWTTLSTVVLFILSIAVLVLQLSSPVYHLVATKTPKDLGFETILYLSPAQELALFQTSPFLEAVLNISMKGKKKIGRPS